MAVRIFSGVGGRSALSIGVEDLGNELVLLTYFGELIEFSLFSKTPRLLGGILPVQKLIYVALS
jgi:hypothetical protein